MPGPETLPSSMRKKKRYIAFRIISENELEFSDIVNAFWHSLLDVFGEVQTSSINFWLVKDAWNKEKQSGLIKCNHRHVSKIRLALALLTRIGDEEVSVKTIGVSGTLKSAKKKYMEEKDLKNFE
ncbi:MAG: Rpp14/Pop5 family protein [Candidatus Aenigmatarchaeota archaeon]